MVNKARLIAMAAAIDYAAIGQAKVKSMMGGTALRNRPFKRFRPFDPLALVFDDAFTCRDLAPGEYAVAMYVGFFDGIRR